MLWAHSHFGFHRAKAFGCKHRSAMVPEWFDAINELFNGKRESDLYLCSSVTRLSLRNFRYDVK